MELLSLALLVAGAAALRGRVTPGSAAVVTSSGVPPRPPAYVATAATHDLDGLDPDFAARLDATLDELADEGIVFELTETIRSADAQAAYYAQGRDADDIAQAANALRANDAPWLADLMARTPPRPDLPHNTDALPGDSWHQHGKAADGMWIRNGSGTWDQYEGGDRNGYARWKTLGELHGLSSGCGWGDCAHLQLPGPSHAPHEVFGWPALDAMMEARA